MAQFNFYGSWADSWAWLETLASPQRFTFAVGTWYARPSPFQFSSLTEEVRQVLQSAPHIYMLAKDYTRFPLHFGRPTHLGLMRIRVSQSGPTLELILPPCFEREGKLRLRVGSLTYQPEYENPETGEWYKPPEALKHAYADVKRILLSRMKKRYIRGRGMVKGFLKPVINPLWFGKDALALLEAGDAVFWGAGEWKAWPDLAEARDELEPLIDEYE